MSCSETTPSPTPRPTPDVPLSAEPGRRFGALVPTLSRLGVTPDMVSWAGLACALGCAICLAMGASHVWPGLGVAVGFPGQPSLWPFAAGLFLGLSCLADLLDGDLARARGEESAAGALLDSALDRVGDLLLYAGPALHFAAQGNVTYVALALLATASALLVSYLKARAASLADGLSLGGYWGRGERMVTLLVGCFLGLVPSALWMLAILPFVTVWRRLREGIAALEGRPRPPGQPWRRSSRIYLVASMGLVALLVALPFVHPWFRGDADPLGAWLR